MGICSRAEMISRGMDLDDLINFEALELIEPSAESQMARYVTVLAAEIEKVQLLLQMVLNKEAKPKQRITSITTLLPCPLDQYEEIQQSKYHKEQEERALQRIREKVVAAAKRVFFKDSK